MLASRRPIFHSEADFQHEFAWQLREMLPHISVRLEHPVGNGSRGAIDVVVRSDGPKQAFELKYLCKKFQAIVNDEPFTLRQQGARDQRRYDVCKDILRMEAFSQQTGYPSTVLVLTNDYSFWRGSSSVAIDAAFCIAEGRTLQGSLVWAARAAPGSIKGREQALALGHCYTPRWQDYSELGGRAGTFRFLRIEVPTVLGAGGDSDAI